MDTEHYPVSKRSFVAGVLFAVILSGACLSGCATSGKARINKVMNEIKQGETTKEKVKELLGDPTGINKNADGSEVWTYSTNDLNQKMAQRTALTGARSLAGFVPIIGPALSIATMGAVVTPQKTTFETTVINFDREGIVASVTTSTQGNQPAYLTQPIY